MSIRQHIGIVRAGSVVVLCAASAAASASAGAASAFEPVRPATAERLAAPSDSWATTHEAGLSMTVDRKAQLLDGGERARLRVTASCPAGAQLLESFVYVNQDGNSTEWGAVNVPCDGVSHQTLVDVVTLDFVLHKGKASASGYMLLTTGESISPTARLKLK